MNKLLQPFQRIFDWEHILTPVAIEQIIRHKNGQVLDQFRYVYVFGIRVAFYRG